MLNPSGGSVAEVIHPDPDPVRIGRYSLQLEPGEPALDPDIRVGGGEPGELRGGVQGRPRRRGRLDPRGDLHRAKGLGGYGGWTHCEYRSRESQKHDGRKALPP